MNVLSLFDGMGCGWIALKELRVKVDHAYSSEIDKFAISQVRYNFPNVTHLGSVTDVDVSKLEPIDFVMAGSPCQSFSMAGKRVGMSTVDKEEVTTLERYLELKEGGFQFEGQSYLFWEFMRIITDIRKYNPNVLFFLENVVMGKKWESVLNEAIGLRGVHINAALVSAQNRRRIYWTNIRVGRDSLFDLPYSDIPQPEDKGILLKDILEEEVDEKYYLKDEVVQKLIAHRERNKANGNGFGATPRSCDEKMNCIRVRGKGTYDLVKIDRKGNLKKDQHKTSTLTVGGHGAGNHSDMDLICVAMRGRNPDNPSDRTAGAYLEQRIEANTQGKTNCLTTVSKDNLIMKMDKKINPIKRIEDNICNLERKSKCVTTSVYKEAQNDSTTLVERRSRIRRLTPTECARLQTIPDWYEWKGKFPDGSVKDTSDTQIYKMCGNGWCVEVIKHVFSFINHERFDND